MFCLFGMAIKHDITDTSERAFFSPAGDGLFGGVGEAGALEVGNEVVVGGVGGVDFDEEGFDVGEMVDGAFDDEMFEAVDVDFEIGEGGRRELVEEEVKGGGEGTLFGGEGFGLAVVVEGLAKGVAGSAGKDTTQMKDVQFLLVGEANGPCGDLFCHLVEDDVAAKKGEILGFGLEGMHGEATFSGVEGVLADVGTHVEEKGIGGHAVDPGNGILFLGKQGLYSPKYMRRRREELDAGVGGVGLDALKLFQVHIKFPFWRVSYVHKRQNRLYGGTHHYMGSFRLCCNFAALPYLLDHRIACKIYIFSMKRFRMHRKHVFSDAITGGKHHLDR